MACRLFDFSSPLLKSAAQVVEWDDGENRHAETEAHCDQGFGDTPGDRRRLSRNAVTSQHSESTNHADHRAQKSKQRAERHRGIKDDYASVKEVQFPSSRLDHGIRKGNLTVLQPIAKNASQSVGGSPPMARRSVEISVLQRGKTSSMRLILPDGLPSGETRDARAQHLPSQSTKRGSAT